MSGKRSSAQKRAKNPKEEEQKISSFFKPQETRSSGRKRSRNPEVEETDIDRVPEAKRSTTIDADERAASRSLSPEQVSRMERSKSEAEVKLYTRKLGLDATFIDPTWMQVLLPQLKKPYMEELLRFVDKQRSAGNVYPPPEDVFSWTLACPIEDVKVVVIGQDPYHSPGQAHGLCFSVRVGVRIPPSLQNIYKELMNSIEGFSRPDHGYLAGWAQQGVLLLNACLTVREKQPNSHAGKGWEKLTDAVIHWINEHSSGAVFLLWGAYAQKKGSFINDKKHCVLKTVHPSPLSASRGFFGCDHFSKANAYLRKINKKEIDWNYLPKSMD